MTAAPESIRSLLHKCQVFRLPELTEMRCAAAAQAFCYQAWTPLTITHVIQQSRLRLRST